jgi:cell division protein FtsL
MSNYNIDGLKNGILNAQNSITALKQAIAKERRIIKEYEQMINALKEKEKIDIAIKSIEIVRE